MTALPSQVANPWRAVKRTVVAVATGAATTLVVLATMLQIFADTFDGTLSGEVIAWAASAAGFLILLSGAVTRIMAIPAVNEFLKKLALDAPAPVETTLEYKPLVEIPDYPNK